MATLLLTDVPEAIREEIERLASARRSTIEEEAVRALRRGLATQTGHVSQAELLAALRRRSITPPIGTPNSVELLREDRAR